MIQSRPMEIIEKLNQAGYEAYFVGGCVRDFLLNRPCHDWDITTSALPAQVLALFPDSKPTGVSHGTVTVFWRENPVEVTTFRADGCYADCRHPQQVQFVTDLAEDLKRRDFTINALAMDASGTVTDLFAGREDLNCRQIRCIGCPEVRFQEDALRMFRAVRFAAQLAFTLEPETCRGIRSCAHLSAHLSVERIRDELEKILLSDHPEMLVTMEDLGLLAPFCPKLCGDLRKMAELPRERMIRWVALCQYWDQIDLRKLHLDKKTILSAAAVSKLTLPKTRLGWKQLLAAHGKEIVSLFACISGYSELVAEILCSGECVALSELAVGGRDFPEITGKSLGDLLEQILQDVLQNPDFNNRDKILKKYKN